MSNLSQEPVVIDNGSGSTRAGFAGDQQPRVSLPTIIGQPRHQNTIPGSTKKDIIIGNDVLKTRDLFIIKHPIEHGVVKNWDDLESIWGHLFQNELRIVPEEHPIMLTEPPLNPKLNKEKMSEYMFEKFKVPSLYIANTGVLILYSSGRMTGLIVESGHGVTYTMPIYEGYSITEGINRLDIGGNDLTEFLTRILHESFKYFQTSSEKEMFKQIKETVCHVADDVQQEISDPVVYTLPDGHEISFKNERFMCPEALFQPCYLGIEKSGIHDMCRNSIIKCDMTLRKEFYGNIVLSGGSTLFPGFVERMNKEVSSFAPKNVSININAGEERINSVWKGGSILASLSTFQNQWVTKKEFEEHGSSIIHRKCF